jgi:hypothetical protein
VKLNWFEVYSEGGNFRAVRTEEEVVDLVRQYFRQWQEGSDGRQVHRLTVDASVACSNSANRNGYARATWKDMPASEASPEEAA